MIAWPEPQRPNLSDPIWQKIEDKRKADDEKLFARRLENIHLHDNIILRKVVNEFGGRYFEVYSVIKNRDALTGKIKNYHQRRYSSMDEGRAREFYDKAVQIRMTKKTQPFKAKISEEKPYVE